MEIKKVFVLGAGLMGFGITQVAAQNGYEVKVYDVFPEALEKGLAGTTKALTKQVTKGKISEEEKEAVLGRITLCNALEDCKDADLVIEAVPEVEELKLEMLGKISDLVRPEAIIATNTSSISISSLATAVDVPERFIGMHFFSPVPAMKLLEIVVGLVTSKETLDIAKEVGEKLGKEVIVSKDEPGFIVNRMIAPMANQAVKLLERGVGTIEDIDRGCKFGLNHPIGPLELIDATGINVCCATVTTIFKETGEAGYAPAVLMKTMVRSGYTGKKVGKGFYIYHEDGTKTPNPAVMGLLTK